MLVDYQKLIRIKLPRYRLIIPRLLSLIKSFHFNIIIKLKLSQELLILKIYKCQIKYSKRK